MHKTNVKSEKFPSVKFCWLDSSESKKLKLSVSKQLELELTKSKPKQLTVSKHLAESTPAKREMLMFKQLDGTTLKLFTVVEQNSSCKKR